jgi:hypothetical protein
MRDRTVLQRIDPLIELLERSGWTTNLLIFDSGTRNYEGDGVRVRLNVDHIASVEQNYSAANVGGFEWLEKNAVGSREFASVREAMVLDIDRPVLEIRRVLDRYRFGDQEVAEFAREGHRLGLYSEQESDWLARAGAPRPYWAVLNRSFYLSHLDDEHPLVRAFIAARMSPTDDDAEATW